MKWMTASIVAGLALLGARAGSASQPEPSVVWGTCSVCHGHDGISPDIAFPNLAGQPETYLETELNDFRDRSRADHDAKAYMWSMATDLSNKKTIAQVAQYFAALAPPKGKSGEDPAEIASGRKIFEQGIASENVTACQSCHGAKANGNGPSPRLAGQHREYLVAQLEAFRSGERDDPIMHPIAEHVTDTQIRDVTAYLASL